MKFTIPGQLPGLNEILKAYKGAAWYAGAAQKKKHMRRCAMVMIAAGVPVFKGPVTIAFDWIEPHRRRDIDNIAAGTKFILDALILANRLPNDSRRWVRSLKHQFPEPDPKNPRIEIEINEIEKETV